MSQTKIMLILVSSDGQSKCRTPDRMSFEEYENEDGKRFYVCTEKSCKRQQNCTVTIEILTPSTIDELTLKISNHIITKLCT